MRKRVSKGQIKIGEAIPWDLYNAEGYRIFRKGFIFHNNESLSRVAQMELYQTVDAEQHDDIQPLVDLSPDMQWRRRQVMHEFAASKDEIDQQIGGNIFHLIDYCIATAETICGQIIGGSTEQLAGLNLLVENVTRAFAASPEACLAAVHMDYEHPLSSMQPVYTAFLCLLMAEGLHLPWKNKRSLVAAALSANLGMFKYFDYLVKRNSPLNNEEKVFVRAHPESSYKMLLDNHVVDEIWLHAVLQHHERGEGSGYPVGLKHDAISLEASLLGVADTYIAMVTPRAYRESLMPKAAMQQIYKTAVANEDLIAIGLIKQLGIYPPGSLVRLANQEIAIVVERNKQSSVTPKVAAIGNYLGRPYAQHIVRQSDTPTYKIIEAYRPDSPMEIDMNQLWKCQVPPEPHQGNLEQ